MGRVKGLVKAFGENVKREGKALNMRAFADFYRPSHSRVQRELKVDFTGLLLRDDACDGWIYPEYSAIKAQKAKGRTTSSPNSF